MFAILIPWVKTEYGEALLMEVRSQKVKQPGEICFPGGKVEHGETPVETAIRETYEELGILPSDIEIISEPELISMSDGRKGYSVQGVVNPEILGICTREHVGTNTPGKAFGNENAFSERNISQDTEQVLSNRNIQLETELIASEWNISQDTEQVLSNRDSQLETEQITSERSISQDVKRRFPGLTISEYEVSEVFLLPLSWLRHNPPEYYDLARTEDEELPPRLRRYLSHYGKYRRSGSTDYWEYQGKGIWGLTARVIKKMLEQEYPINKQET